MRGIAVALVLTVSAVVGYAFGHLLSPIVAPIAPTLNQDAIPPIEHAYVPQGVGYLEDHVLRVPPVMITAPKRTTQPTLVRPAPARRPSACQARLGGYVCS